MGESIKRIVGPYQDSYSPNGIIGEKDACGVGFIANIEGVESNWILKQSLKGLKCMEHRGGCGGEMWFRGWSRDSMFNSMAIYRSGNKSTK